MAVQLEEPLLVNKSKLINELESDSEDEQLQLSFKSKKFVVSYSDDEDSSPIDQRELKDSLEKENESSSGNQVVKKTIHQNILDDSEDSDGGLVIDQQDAEDCEETRSRTSPALSSKKRIIRRTILEDSDSENETETLYNQKNVSSFNQKKARKSIHEDSDSSSDGGIRNQLRLELPTSESDVSDGETKTAKNNWQTWNVMADATNESSNDSEIMKTKRPKRKSGFVSDEKSNSSLVDGNVLIHKHFHFDSMKLTDDLFWI